MVPVRKLFFLFDSCKRMRFNFNIPLLQWPPPRLLTTATTTTPMWAVPPNSRRLTPPRHNSTTSSNSNSIYRFTNSLFFRVADPDPYPDPDWIRIQSGQWIQEGKNDPQK
jgi:hypothetical protein